MVATEETTIAVRETSEIDEEIVETGTRAIKEMSAIDRGAAIETIHLEVLDGAKMISEDLTEEATISESIPEVEKSFEELEETVMTFGLLVEVAVDPEVIIFAARHEATILVETQEICHP